MSNGYEHHSLTTHRTKAGRKFNLSMDAELTEAIVRHLSGRALSSEQLSALCEMHDNLSMSLHAHNLYCDATARTA